MLNFEGQIAHVCVEMAMMYNVSTYACVVSVCRVMLNIYYDCNVCFVILCNWEL